MFLFMVIYFAYLSDKVVYGPEQIRKVRIPQAPEEVKELLKTTTYRGDLIYVYLISVFGNDKKLSQTDLVNRVKERYRIQLTHQSIRKYILDLQRYGLIHSPKTSREYEYSLTEQGLWCSHAIKVCFPRTIYWFIIRHYLGIRHMPEFPKNELQRT